MATSRNQGWYWVVAILVPLLCIWLYAGKSRVVKKTSDDQKTVTIITWEGDLIGESPDIKIARTLREEFARTHPSIKVIHRTAPSGEQRKVYATAMAGGTGPDLSLISGVNTRTYIEEGFAADITDLLEEWRELDNIYPNMLKPVIKNNRYYGLPTEYYMMYLAYRTDIYQKVGLDPVKPPKTWEEFIDYAQRLTNKAENRYGFGILGMDFCAWHFMDYVWQAGGDFMRVDPKTKKMISIFHEEPGIVALQFYKDLRWKYDVIQNNVLQDVRDLVNDFVTGRCAMYKFYAQDMSTLLLAGLTTDQIGLAPLPSGPAKVPASQMAPLVYIINPTSSKEKQRAAFEYIRFQVSKETMIKRCKLQEKYDILAPTIPLWKGIQLSDIVKFPEQWSKAIEEQSKFARPEPFFPQWDKVKQYLIQPIQAVLLEPNADPRKEMIKCSKRVQKELFDKFGPVDL